MLVCPWLSLEHPHFPEDIVIVLNALAVMKAFCPVSDSHGIH